MISSFDPMKIRKDFPVLNRKIYGKPLVYLDNAATTLKPQRVIDRLTRYYSEESANVHRSAYLLSSEGTVAYEMARETVQKFIGARESSEIIFTRGTTESINLVASSFGSLILRAGDEILLTEMEHHSNIVPWQILAEKTGAIIKVVPVTDIGELDLDAYAQLLSQKTKIVAVAQCSNTLGTINDVKKISQLAHTVGAKVLVDAAQSVAHEPINVVQMDCDFLVFSGHKLYGPFGAGVLYAKAELLESMPPYQGGGSMISEVRFEKTTYAPPPQRFEAGTPSIADVLGMASGIEFVSEIGFAAIESYEAALLKFATAQLKTIPGLKIIGEAAKKGAIISFVFDGIHASDIGSILDQQGIAVRTGHHCTQPLMRRFGVPATARASFALYNTKSEVEYLRDCIVKAKEFF